MCATCGTRMAEVTILCAVLRRIERSGSVSTGPSWAKSGNGSMSRYGMTDAACAANSACACASLAGGGASGAPGSAWACAAPRPFASAWRLTSSGVTRPAGPVGGMACRSTPSSRARRRVAGAAGTGPGGRAVERSSGRAVVAPSSITAITWPTCTTSPGLPTTWTTMPERGDGIVTAALSVSTSTSGSSSLIVSPGWTCHLRISPSWIPSPRSGSLNSNMAALL